MKLKNRIRKFAVIISVFHLLIASGMTQDLAVKAYLNKTTVGLNQQFTLSLELSGAGANTNLNPELPRMDNFASFLGSGSSQNIQFVNGKMSVSKTISYHYMASTAGKFQIEAISVQHKGKTYKTDPISIELPHNSLKPPKGRPHRSRGADRQKVICF